MDKILFETDGSMFKGEFIYMCDNCGDNSGHYYKMSDVEQLTKERDELRFFVAAVDDELNKHKFSSICFGSKLHGDAKALRSTKG